MNINKERLINFFQKIVSIDSISREERKLTDFLINEFSEMGLDFNEDNADVKIGGNSGNLIIDVPGDSELEPVLLSAHLDRVEPGKGIVPIIEDGYILSSGDTILAGDDLIGVACIIEAIKVLRENEIPHRPCKIIFTVAEEVGLLGAKAIDIEELSSVKYGFVFDVDGDVGTIVNSAPTQLKFNVKIYGKSAHAGIEPDKGINAIKIASMAISNMKLGQVDDKTTANIGVIKGGIASNVIPDMVEMEGEVRSRSEELLEKQQRHMRDIFERSCKKYRGRAVYDIEKIYSGFAIPAESDIIRFVKKNIEGLNFNFQLTASGGGSDANIFNDMGLPTLNLGVGMENVHSKEERVKIDNLYKVVELVISILTN